MGILSILFFFLQLLLSDICWQFPPDPFRKELRLCRLSKCETSLPWENVILCGQGDTESTGYKGNAGVTGENCLVYVCVYVIDLAEEMSRAEVEIHQDEI